MSLARSSRSSEGGHEALVAVGDGGVEHRRKDALTTRPATAQARNRRLAIDAHVHAELALALTAVDGEHTMVGNLARGLRKVVVRLVGSLLVGIRRHGHDLARTLGKGAQVGNVLGILGHRLGHDIRGTGERLLGRVVAGLGGLGRDKARSGILRRGRALGRDLHDDHVGKRLEPGLAGLLRARLALLAVGLVEVLDALELRGRADLGLELGGELALGANENDDVLLALLEIAQVGEALLERAEGDVVHATRRLLAVARDEGDGVALVDKGNGRLHGGALEAELLGKCGDDIHTGSRVVVSLGETGYPPVRTAANDMVEAAWADPMGCAAGGQCGRRVGRRRRSGNT